MKDVCTLLNDKLLQDIPKTRRIFHRLSELVLPDNFHNFNRQKAGSPFIISLKRLTIVKFCALSSD